MKKVLFLVGFSLLLFFSLIIAALYKKKHVKSEEEFITFNDGDSASLSWEIVLREESLPSSGEGEELSEEKGGEEASSLPEGSRMAELFISKGMPSFPFVEVITYQSKVPWKPNKLAWLVDYARYYQTSRYFISRSLSRKRDYFFQEVRNGERFNVFGREVLLSFYLLVDLSRCKVWLFAHEEREDRYTFLSCYRVGLGRKEERESAKSLTPTGVYRLGNKVAIYSNHSVDFFEKKKRSMIEIFGTRWIPFEEEIDNCSEPVCGDSGKHFGVHGIPWEKRGEEWVERRELIGEYASDGCVRLLSEDMEELFAVIISRKSYIEIVPRAENSFLYEKLKL